MGNVKKVLINSYSPHAVSRNHENYWDDIWLVFHRGRRVVKLGPCVMSGGYVDAELAMMEDGLAEHSAKGELIEEERFSEDLVIPLNHAELAAYYREEADRYRAMKERFTAGDELVVDDAEGKDTPDIYIRADKLTRERIEIGLKRYLRDRGHIKSGSCLKFVWRRPKFLVRSFPE
jgi:hypothetical protein